MNGLSDQNQDNPFQFQVFKRKDGHSKLSNYILEESSSIGSSYPVASGTQALV
jgi:hypothetical protein